GGGLIINPNLYVVFHQLQYDPTVIMHMAVGTSLATIIVTSISSVMAHHKKGAVLWHVFKNMAPGLVIGSLLGAGIADLLSGPHLQMIIGSFAIWVAFKMFKGAHTVVDQT
ncbi:UNVERIFIED_CONTAM: TSUP family transporter, partial [Serratia marcescens]